MKNDRAPKLSSLRGNFVKFVIAGVVAASCAVTVFAFAAQMDSGRFDPGSLMGTTIGMQSNPEFNTAYNVADQSQSGQANMNRNQGDQNSQQPNLEQVQTADFQQSDASGSGALRVTDGNADMSIIANGGGGSASSNGGIAGPVIGGDGSGGDEGGGGGGSITDPDPTTPVLPDPWFGDSGNNFGGGLLPILPRENRALPRTSTPMMTLAAALRRCTATKCSLLSNCCVQATIT